MDAENVVDFIFLGAKCVSANAMFDDVSGPLVRTVRDYAVAVVVIKHFLGTFMNVNPKNGTAAKDTYLSLILI